MMTENVPGLIFQLVVPSDERPSYFAYASAWVFPKFGLTPEQLRESAHHLFAKVHAEDLPGFQGSLAEAAQTLAIWEWEGRVWFADGQPGVIQGRATPQPQPNGEVVWHGMISDITERKRAEEAMRVSEERFSKAFAGVPVAMSINRLTDARFLEINDRFTSLLGWTPEETIGQVGPTLKLWINPDDRARMYDLLHREGRVRDFPTQFRTKSGEARDILLSCEIFEVGGEQYQLVMLADVTERKQAEEALRASEAQLTEALKAARLAEQASREIENLYRRAIASADAVAYSRRYSDETFTFMGERILEITGYSAAEMTTKIFDGLIEETVVRAADLAHADAVHQARAGQIPHWQADYRLRTRDGQTRWVADTSFEIFGPEGKPVGSIGIMLDITDRKRAEAALREREEDLEALLEFSPDAIGVVNTETGLFENVNEAAERLYGLKREDLVKVGPAHMSPEVQPDGRLSQEKALEKIGEALQGGRPVFEWTHRNAQGDLIPCEVRLVGLTGPRQHLVRFSVTDITERQRAEEALRKSAAELATVAKVSTTAATRLDPQDMLQSVVELTKSEFALYHAHIYLLNDAQDTLILTMGAGDIGREMVAQGRRIPVGREQSLVARAARTRAGVIVNDVSLDPHFLPHPLLPETRSEMAIPMLVGGSVLGVLDVQSAILNRFTDTDVQIMTTLASQVAVALQNARSFERSEKAVAELNTLNRRLTREGWQDYLEAQHRLETGYVYDLAEIKPLEGEMAPAPAAGDNGHLSHPLTVQGEVIGQLAVAKAEVDAGESAEIIAAVAERLGAHLENLRLTEETQAALATTESLYKIGSRIAAANDLQEVLASVGEGLPHPGINRLVLFTYEFNQTNELEAVEVVANWYNGEGPLPSPVGTRYPKAVFDTFRLMLSPTPVYFSDMYSDPRVDANTLTAAQRLNVRAVVSLPLRLGGRQVGTLLLEGAEPHDFTEREIQPYLSAAETIAVALENRRLLQQTQENLDKQRRLSTELETVAEVTKATSTILDSRELLQSVVDLAKARFGLYHAHVYLYDEVSETLQLTAGAGRVGEQMAAEGKYIPIALERSIVARAARTMEPQLVNNVHQSADFLPNPLLPETRSEVAIPMLVGDKLLGVYDVQSDEYDHFSVEDVRIQGTLAGQVSIALQNANLYTEQTAAVARLQELDHLKSSFLANMSHELRTPLNSILGFTDVILEGLDGPLTDRMENDLMVVQKNGKHLLELINDVLDMAKIEAGRMSISPEYFNLSEVVEEVFAITGSLAREKSLYLKDATRAYGELDLHADRVRLRQVLINVIGNAVKFTEKGGITLDAERVDEHILIRVHDTGLGIPPEKLEKVFEAFSQVDNTTTRKAGGTGLGLPISRRLIELHGGRLWAESTGVAGEGSTFVIELPIEVKSLLQKDENA
jgi:PAS domain S-box-containing protein